MPLPCLPLFFIAFLAGPAPPSDGRATRARFDLSTDGGARRRVMTRESPATPAALAALRLAVARDLPDLGVEIREDASAPDEHVDGRPHLIDLDGDATADLALVEFTFFGPSEGFHVFGREGAGFRSLFGDPGRLIGAARTPPRSAGWTLRFEVARLAPGEPRVIRVIECGPPPKGCDASLVQVLAAQTKPPAPGTLRPVRLVKEARLRMTPRLDDTTRPITADDGDEATTATLGGNVVAEYAAGASGTQLARRGRWAFVALASEPAPSRTSFHHGLFVANLGEDIVSRFPRGATYDGWVPFDALGDPPCTDVSCLVGVWRQAETCAAARRSVEAWRFVRGGRDDADGVFEMGRLKGRAFRPRPNGGPSGPAWKSGWRLTGEALWLGHDGAEETLSLHSEGDTLRFDGGCLVRMAAAGR